MLWLLSDTQEVQDAFTQLQIITPGISSGLAVALLEQHRWSFDALAGLLVCAMLQFCVWIRKASQD